MNDPHACSIVLRKLLRRYEAHKQASYSMYQSLPTDQRLQIDDKCRLRFRKMLIRKESSVFAPSVSKEVYTITEIDKSKLPYLYKINNGKNQLYYAWNLLKVDKDMLAKISEPIERNKNQQTKAQPIKVQMVVNETKQLKNGKKIPNPSGAMYKIQKENETKGGEYVTKNTLMKYKELFGDNILQYDEIFMSDPYYKNFIV